MWDSNKLDCLTLKLFEELKFIAQCKDLKNS